MLRQSASGVILMSRESLGTILGDTLSKGFSIVLVPMQEVSQVRVELTRGEKTLFVVCDIQTIESAIGMLIKGLRTAIGPEKEDGKDD